MPHLKLDRFLDQFVTGSLVFIGTWYLHRPFLLEYFPNLTGDPSSGGTETLGIQAAAVLFIVGSICCGVILSHSADVMAIAIFREPAVPSGKIRWTRRLISFGGRSVAWKLAPDPRVGSVGRYLLSHRRGPFLDLIGDWAMTSRAQLEGPDESSPRLDESEAVLVHQHLVSRLRTHSDATRAVLNAAYAQLRFAGSLALAFMALLPLTGLSFITSALVEDVRHVLPNRVKILVLLLVYVAAAVTAYSYRRRFRDFAAYVVTNALHFHEEHRAKVDNSN